jgi:hypothetical protein
MVTFWGLLKEKDSLVYSSKSLLLLVRPGWLEHPTYGFVVRCSIQLSYGRISIPPIPPSSRKGRRRLFGGFFPLRAKETTRRPSLAKGEGAADHHETNPPKRKQAGMNEREYKDFPRNGPAFFVHANMLEFLVFPGFLTQRGAFLPAKHPGSRSASPPDRCEIAFC